MERRPYEALQSAPGLGTFDGGCGYDRLLCPVRDTLVRSTKGTKRHEECDRALVMDRIDVENQPEVLETFGIHKW